MQSAIRSEFPQLPRLPGLSGLAIALLCVGLTGCQRHAPPAPAARPAPAAAVQPPEEAAFSMETRSLLPEIDQAKFGAAAQVRTRFRKGSGLVLPAEHEVLAHLHVVLTLKNKIADPIFVNLSGSSNRAKDELHAYVVAQDPTHDLVLLKIGAAPVNSRPDVLTGKSAQPHEAHHRHAHRARLRRSSGADPSGSPHDASAKKKAPKVKTHVVYDGPDNSDNNDSQKLNP